jgi:hypothetical protein
MCCFLSNIASAAVAETPSGRYAGISGTKYQYINTNADFHLYQTRVWKTASESVWMAGIEMHFVDEFAVSPNQVGTRIPSTGMSSYNGNYWSA